jgi:hypothetical protein
MKPTTIFVLFLFTAVLFMAGALFFAADRAVQAEYAHRAQSESVIATRITQYQDGLTGEKAGTFTGGGMLTAVLAFTVMFTALGTFMGKEGLTGVLRQLHRMKPKKPRSHPAVYPAPVNVPMNAPAPLALPDYTPRRDELTTAVNTPTREGGQDANAIQWT